MNTDKLKIATVYTLGAAAMLTPPFNLLCWVGGYASLKLNVSVFGWSTAGGSSYPATVQDVFWMPFYVALAPLEWVRIKMMGK